LDGSGLEAVLGDKGGVDEGGRCAAVDKEARVAAPNLAFEDERRGGRAQREELVARRSRYRKTWRWLDRRDLEDWRDGVHGLERDESRLGDDRAALLGDSGVKFLHRPD
jgi:hypothetical protein